MTKESSTLSGGFGGWCASPRATTLLLLSLFGQTALYGFYQYARLKRQLQPEELTATAEAVIREKYPAVREAAVRKLKQRAPRLAEQLGDELVASLPEIRQWLETVAARQVASGLDQATELSADQFRAFLRDNRRQVRTTLQQADQAPEEAQRLVRELEAQMEKHLGTKLRQDAKFALQWHRQLNDKLEWLSGEGPLGPKELLERRIARILRALARERLPDLSPPEFLTPDEPLDNDQ